MQHKSTLQEIEERFDNDVARFSNLETGQLTTLDATLNMDLIVQGIVKCYPNLSDVLDIGCGAGNYDVKLLSHASPLNITLADLSMPMLTEAKARVSALNKGGSTTVVKGDFRALPIEEGTYDVIIATAVLHHLREDADWESSFAKFYKWLKPGGSIWIFDLVQQATEGLQQLIYDEKYGEYLTALQHEDYRDHVFSYIAKEDSPRSLSYQLELMRKIGFKEIDILHKNLCFASFVGFK